VNDLCQMLRQIMDHYKEALEISDKAREYVIENFDSNKMAEQYIKLYNECIDKNIINKHPEFCFFILAVGVIIFTIIYFMA